MIKKIIFLIVLFFLLAIVQVSFPLDYIVFIVVFLINFFESAQKRNGILAAFLGGFFLDLLSVDPFKFYFFGAWTIIMILMAYFVKFIIKRYVHIPGIKRF